MNRLLALITLVWVAAGAAPVSAQEDDDAAAPSWWIAADTAWRDRGVWVRESFSPERRLEWELIVPAPVDEVWEAWASEQEIGLWAAPAGAVDLRVGGFWEAYFNPDRPPGERGSEGNEILAFIPGREIRLAAGSPRRNSRRCAARKPRSR